MLSDKTNLANTQYPYVDMKRTYRHKLRLMLAFVFLAVLCIVFINMRGSTSSRELNVKHEISALKQNLRKLTEDCQLLKLDNFNPKKTIIYAITPTYARPVQKAELTRLSHTFMLVPNLHWIVVEDAETTTALVTGILNNSRIQHTHLVAPTPAKWKLKEKDLNWKKPRGVLQRNKAIKWLRDNLNVDKNKGVVYFADDDNSYSLEVFEEMRSTVGVSVWPVGLVGGLMVEKPLLDQTSGRVTGWNSSWKPNRPFPVDMAGFAINLHVLLQNPEAKFSFNVERGYQESEILRHLTSWEQLEPKADNCTKIYVWHTRTEAPKLTAEQKLQQSGKSSDDGMEV